MTFEYMVCVGGACDRPEDERIADGIDALMRAKRLAHEQAIAEADEPVQIVVTEVPG